MTPVPTPSVRLASRGKRLLGALLDGLFAFPCTLFAAEWIGCTDELLRGELTPEQVLALTLASAVAFVVLNGYLLETRGQTVGKLVVGTRIVDRGGQTVPFVRLFALRYAAFTVVGFLPIVGFLVSLADPLYVFSRTRQCLHDRLCDTFVVEVA